MKKIILLLSLLLSFNALADCRPKIEADLVAKLKSQKKVKKVGKIVTGSAFVTVGGFYGTMGVFLLGPLWAGAIVGATFGTAAAIPVGTTFVIINKAKKKQIKNRGNLLSIINSGEELNNLHSSLKINHPELTINQLTDEISKLNESQALCDGTISNYGKSFQIKRTIASPKELRLYLEENL